ncbi:hypothetical protein Sjap_015909 [Stephania japonica]|uniref:Uncharacterized protein n=1 Tax=Stephania japonica TaxID=461633 RepID=A0AAP0NRB3_9MAGN
MDPTLKKRQIPTISSTSITPPPPLSLSDPLLNFKSLTLPMMGSFPTKPRLVKQRNKTQKGSL